MATRKPRNTRSWKRAPKLDQAPRVAQTARMDGWLNVLTGLGDSNRDKRQSSQVQGFRYTYNENRELWRYDDTAARMVEVPVEEMTREGFEVQIAGEKDMAEDVMHALDDLAFDEALVEAAEYMRAYGGGAILVGYNDGVKDLRQPLREDRIQSIDFLTVLKPIEAQGITYYADPAAPKFGQTAIYRVVPELASAESSYPFMPEVHETRMLVFQGNVVAKRQLRENFGWGDSIFNRVFEVIRDFATSYSGAAALIPDFAQAEFSINGLREMLAADDGTNRLKNRLLAMDMARSIIRAIILDAGDASGMGKETFDRKSTNVTGLPELLDRMGQRLASAADMPVERLLGETTKGGLGSGGSSKVEWWEKHIGNMQKRRLLRPIKKFVRLLMLAKKGPTNGKLPDNWGVTFNPLSQMSPVEEAQQRFNIAQADNIYMQAGAVTPEEVANSRFGGDDFSPDTVLDQDLRDELDEAIDRKSEATIGKPDPADLAAQVPPGATTLPVDPTAPPGALPPAQRPKPDPKPAP